MYCQYTSGTVNFFIPIVFFFSFCCAGQVEKTDSLKYLKRTTFLSDNPKQTPLDLLVDSVVRNFIKNPVNSGISIGVSQNGHMYFYNYGETKKGTGQMPRKQTQYEIGSLTTTFCGLLLANAVQENKMKLDDDIRRYLPENYTHLVFGKHAVLVKHLINHTSGLPGIPADLDTQMNYDSLNPYKNYNKSMIYAYLNRIKPEREPGTVCEYSAFGIAVLGILLEKVYGKSFDELVKEKINAVVGMNNTTVSSAALSPEIFCQGYDAYGDPAPAWELGGFVAAGGLRSTTEDMLNYLNYNLEEKDAVTRLAHKVTFSERETLGLGWFIKKTKQGNQLFWHNGGTYGFTGFNGFIKEKNCSVIVLANSATQLDFVAIALLNYLQK